MISTLKKLATAVVVCAALVFTASTTQAQGRRGGSINGRERNQQQRIRQGERSGELTRREAGRLEAEQARIRVDEKYARRSGGELTPEERARLDKELNRSSKDIYQQKHDEQERGNNNPKGINAREENQQDRIQQGVKSGELTRREAERLEAEQARIAVNEKYARRSGDGLSPQERARLEKELNKSSKDIYKQKHDGQTHN